MHITIPRAITCTLREPVTYSTKCISIHSLNHETNFKPNHKTKPQSETCVDLSLKSNSLHNDVILMVTDCIQPLSKEMKQQEPHCHWGLAVFCHTHEATDTRDLWRVNCGHRYSDLFSFSKGCTPKHLRVCELHCLQNEHTTLNATNFSLHIFQPILFTLLGLAKVACLCWLSNIIMNS